MWTFKRTRVKLSAFAASTLANANLLNLDDLRLFRPREYYTDEGPWDPVSGLLTAPAGAIGGMLLGLADFPAETIKMFNKSTYIREQSPAPALTKHGDSSSTVASAEQSQKNLDVHGRLTPSISRNHSQTSLSTQESLTRVRSSRSCSKLSTATYTTLPTSAFAAAQSEASLNQKDLDNSRNSNQHGVGSIENRDMLRPTGAHMSKGAGKVLKSFAKAPVNMSVNSARGFHNVPKIWGDDTVRPLERVTDLSSGVKAVGREFGFGIYDGVTGLVTQPWQGAKKEGIGGFIKGMGKGVGGLLAKPSATMFGVLGYSLQASKKNWSKDSPAAMCRLILLHRGRRKAMKNGYKAPMQRRKMSSISGS